MKSSDVAYLQSYARIAHQETPHPHVLHVVGVRGLFQSYRTLTEPW